MKRDVMNKAFFAWPHNVECTNRAKNNNQNLFLTDNEEVQISRYEADSWSKRQAQVSLSFWSILT